MRIKAFGIAVLISFVFVVSSSAQGRKVASFDANWRFFKGDVSGAETIKSDDSKWRMLDVPHDWSIEGPFNEANKTGGAGGFLPAGVAWYRKHFVVPASEKGRKVLVEFDGVMGISDVWLNGVHLGTRPSGYISFEYDLTSTINFGGDNVIAVKADTSLQPASRWYTGAGIYRHVRLVTKGVIQIPKDGVFVSTPEVTAEKASVRIQAEVVNGGKTDRTFAVDIQLLDPSGKLVSVRSVERGTILQGGMENVDETFTIARPDRWDRDHPVMYRAVVSVRSGHVGMDNATVNFGVREYHFEPATGFWLNGKNFKLKGACLHHDGSAFGAAVPLAVWEYRLNALRKLGVNAIRTAHNPPAPEFLDLADRMGFLVMDELFDQWTLGKNAFDYHLYFDEWAKRDVTDTVRRDRNHPSVIIYSAGNEIRDNHADQEKAKATLRGLVDTFHENDPTRPVTQALFRPNIEGANDYNNGLAEILDVVGQNYREKEILAAYKQKPTRKILGTENTHDLVQWIAMRDNPEYSGQFIWVGIDYLGESAAWPNYAFSKGLLDRLVEPRPIGYQRQSWWSDKPMVYMARRVAPPQASPTDPGYEAAEQRRTQTLYGDWTPKQLDPHRENVEVYSNCEEVELFLNGRSLGVKRRPADDSPRNWNVDFERGFIKAVGKNGGKAVAEFELRTAGPPAMIKMNVDKTNLRNNWDDVVFVTASVVDANGVLIPDASAMIEFEAMGPGRIAAVDSADNTDHAPFQTSRRRAFQGKCAALVKATRSAGQVIIRARSGQLKADSVVLTATR